VTAADARQQPGLHGAAGHGFSLRDTLVILHRDRRRILAALFIGLLLTAIGAEIVPDRYTAEAALLLRLGREYMYTPEVGDGAAAQPMAYDLEQTQQAEARILASRDVIDEVVAEMGAATIYPALAAAGGREQQRAKAALSITRALDAELLKGSNLLQISFRHDNPQMAALVLQRLIDAYLRKRMQVFSTAGFGSAQADFAARADELDSAEASAAAFKRTHRIQSFAEEQSLLLAQRNALEQRETDVALNLSQARGRSQALRDRLGSIPSEIVLSSETQRGEAAESARKLMLDLRVKERQAETKFFQSEAAVQDVRAESRSAAEYLQELDANPPRSVRTGRSAVRDGAESELLRASADLGQARAGQSSLQEQRGAIDRRLVELAASERDWRKLERERRLAEANYEAAAKRLRDESALADLDRQRRSNVSVVQKPTVPLEPKSMRSIVIAIGVLLSLCAALLTAFLSALWRDTFLTPEQAQRGLGLPLLGTISRVSP